MDKLDLTQPLEAVHKNTGTVALVSLWVQDADCFIINPPIEGCWIAFQNNGTHLSDRCPWFIRNADLTAKPSTPSNEELTQRMEIPQAMAQRMAAHLRECDQVHGIRPRDATAQRLYDEMKSIVSDLPKPVDPIDPNLIEARAIVASAYMTRGDPVPDRAKVIIAGKCDDDFDVKLALTCLKRGIKMAEGGTAHE